MSTKPISAPFRLNGMAIEEDWIDYNGHLNLAYYIVLFDRCVDEFFEVIGAGLDYVENEKASFFTVEMHINYLSELTLDAKVDVALHVVDYDHKRLHTYLEMFHADQGFVAAACEQMYVHVDLTTRGSTEIGGAVDAEIAAMKAAHAGLPRKCEIGQRIGLKPWRL